MHNPRVDLLAQLKELDPNDLCAVMVALFEAAEPAQVIALQSALDHRATGPKQSWERDGYQHEQPQPNPDDHMISFRDRGSIEIVEAKS